MARIFISTETTPKHLPVYHENINLNRHQLECEIGEKFTDHEVEQDEQMLSQFSLKNKTKLAI